MVRLERYAPPGMNLRQLKTVFWGGLIIALVYSLSFFSNLYATIHEILQDMESTLQWLPAEDYYAFTYPFDYFIDPAIKGFRILPVCFLPFGPIQYAYFYQDSKSIYTMRRLKSAWELHIRCWALPLGCVILSVLAAQLVYWLYYVWYLLAIPDFVTIPDSSLDLIYIFLHFWR